MVNKTNQNKTKKKSVQKESVTMLLLKKIIYKAIVRLDERLKQVSKNKRRKALFVYQTKLIKEF